MILSQLIRNTMMGGQP